MSATIHGILQTALATDTSLSVTERGTVQRLIDGQILAITVFARKTYVRNYG